MPQQMKGLIKRLREIEQGADHYVYYHYSSDDALAEFIVTNLLREAKEYVDLGKGRSLMFHKAHDGQGQDHVHFCVKKAKVYAINQDGTAHDRSHGVKMQRWALDGLEKNYPEFKRPKDGLIEALLAGPSGPMLTEGAGAADVLVPPEVQALAESYGKQP